MVKQILSFDLSLNSTGYSLLEFNTVTQEVTLLKEGLIKPNKKALIGNKLTYINICVKEIIMDIISNKPKEIELQIVREKGFSKFVKATESLNMVNGAVIMAMNYFDLYYASEIAPTSVKKQLTGNGNALKKEVAEAIKKFITKGGRDYTEAEYDISDSIAVGISHLMKEGCLYGKKEKR